MPEKLKLNSANTFCWIELACKDMPTAKEFYGSLMGWKFLDDKTPEGGIYASIKLGQKGLVGGLYEFALPDEGKNKKKKNEPEVPAFWGSYIATKNLAATTKKASKLGATIVVDNVPIGNAGMMSVIQDPSGIMFGIWEAAKLAGFGPERDSIGAPGWNELLTADEEESVEFYSKLFGWKAQKKKIGNKMIYTHFTVEDKAVAGLTKLTPALASLPPHWLVHFNVKNCEKSTKLAVEKGGTILVPPSEIPNGRQVSVILDTEGATFALIHQAEEK